MNTEQPKIYICLVGKDIYIDRLIIYKYIYTQYSNAFLNKFYFDIFIYIYENMMFLNNVLIQTNTDHLVKKEYFPYLGRLFPWHLSLLNSNLSSHNADVTLRDVSFHNTFFFFIFGNKSCCNLIVNVCFDNKEKQW